MSSSDKLDSPSSQVRPEKSKTEKPRRNNILVEEAPQIFNENISIHQKGHVPVYKVVQKPMES